jgi:HEAT repeat protein
VNDQRTEDLARLLDDPNDDDGYDRAFGEPETLAIDDGLLPHEDDQPFLLKELVCNLLADIGPAAYNAVPALCRCAKDDTESTPARFMRLAAAKAIWEITRDPNLCLSIWERLLADSECWARRYAAELMEEIGHPAAIPALQSRLHDDRMEVRQAARLAIVRITGGAS